MEGGGKFGGFLGSGDQKMGKLGKKWVFSALTPISSPIPALVPDGLAGSSYPPTPVGSPALLVQGTPSPPPPAVSASLH